MTTERRDAYPGVAERILVAHTPGEVRLRRQVLRGGGDWTDAGGLVIVDDPSVLEDLLRALRAEIDVVNVPARKAEAPAPVPMLLVCPFCGTRHVDAGVFAEKPHHTHACQECGMCWRPAVVPTVGVRFLPGFKDAP